MSAKSQAKPKVREGQPQAHALKEPTVIRLRVDQILPNPENAREHDAEQIRLIQKSMGHYGLVALPIVQKGSHKLLAGHGRLEALKANGQGSREIPVLEVDLSDQDAIAYGVVDNRLTDLSQWNIPALRGVIAELDDGAFDVELMGFTEVALGDLFPVEEPGSGLLKDKDLDSAPEAPEKPITRRGDLWLLGRHRLMCSDATVESDVLTLMDGRKADMVLTDPPYGVSYESESKGLKKDGKSSIINDSLTGQAFQDFLDATFENYAAVTTKKAAFYVFYPSRFHIEFETGMLKAGIEVRAQIIWSKKAASFGFSQYKWKHEPVLHGAKIGEVPLIYVPTHETAFYAFSRGESPTWEGDRTQTTVWVCGRETNYKHPCLSPDSLVVTQSGYRAIGDVAVGDKVLSHDGNFHAVTATTRHPYKKDIYQIGVQGTNLSVRASDNHPFLSARALYDGTKIVGFKAGWVTAEKLCVGDFILSPLPRLGAGSHLSKEEAFVFGLFAAQGSYQSAGHGDNKYPVFSLHQKRTDLIDRLVLLYGEKVKVYQHPHNKGVAVMVFLPDLGERIHAFCGRYAYGKTISESIWSLNQEIAREFFLGYIEGDGCRVRTYLSAKSVSSDLASQLCCLADAVGWRSTCYLYTPKKGSVGARKIQIVRPTYHMTFHPLEKAGLKRKMQATAVFEYEGEKYFLRRIKEVSAIPYDGEIINLSVDGAHTFQTVIGMSHNTQKPVELLKKAIFNSSKPKMLVLDLFAGSGSTLIACEDTGRTCFTCEMDEKFCDVVALRFEELTGRKGTLIRDGKPVKR